MRSPMVIIRDLLSVFMIVSKGKRVNQPQISFCQPRVDNENCVLFWILLNYDPIKIVLEIINCVYYIAEIARKCYFSVQIEIVR